MSRIDVEFRYEKLYEKHILKAYPTFKDFNQYDNTKTVYGWALNHGFFPDFKAWAEKHADFGLASCSPAVLIPIQKKIVTMMMQVFAGTVFDTRSKRANNEGLHDYPIKYDM